MTNDLIMSSVRPEQSGQAAAVSETAYELGTAFGTAILGSVLPGFYRMGLADTAPVGLPGGVLDAAQETLAGALLYARELPGELGEALATAATDAFTSALSATVRSLLRLRRISTVDRTWSSGHPRVREEQDRLRRDARKDPARCREAR
ncbi:hypothetical protein GTW20_25395 [Nocardiopsis alba]|uniref:Uncharacterized protein n=1 Tax=Nocardiopsis alba TaxID=53437 RepID=A0A7K2J072_9ACTN|nr:hypothetical protein [Nocardiopsis alba]MYR35506.1 hypothetical protein [Nocardiopsis alba]